MPHELIDSVLASLPEVDLMPPQNIKSESGLMLPIRGRTMKHNGVSNRSANSSVAQPTLRGFDTIARDMDDGLRGNAAADRFNGRLFSGPLPMEGSPQDRFRREVLGFSQYDGRHAMPQGNSGRMMTGTAPAPAQDFFGSPLQGFMAPIQQPMPSMGMPPTRPIPVAPASGRSFNTSNPRLKQHNASTPAQLLSQECQLRHFNPSFQETKTPDGKFVCKVLLLNNVVIGDGRVFSTPAAAKQSAASRALPIVRSWRIRNPVHPASTSQANRITGGGLVRRSNGPEPPQNRRCVQGIKEEGGDSFMSETHLENNTNRPGAFNRNDETNSGAPQPTLTSEQTDFFQQICQTLGMPVPDPAKTSEEVTRAFLNGLALGSRLRRDRSSRSRSPRPRRSSPGRRYDRSRSPARDRLTPLPHYDQWRGRPHTDRWRPGEEPATNRRRVRELSSEDGEVRAESEGSKRALSQP